MESSCCGRLDEGSNPSGSTNAKARRMAGFCIGGQGHRGYSFLKPEAHTAAQDRALAIVNAVRILKHLEEDLQIE